MINAIVHEVESHPYVQNAFDRNVETVYFGGGTPSLLSPDDIARLMNALSAKYNINESAEITLEANPDDITFELLNAWKITGINRLSIGVQSFHDGDLLWMNRAHNAKQAYDAILAAKDSGFSISIDLIYGGPTLEDDLWNENLDRFFSLDIPHLSSYALTVEPSTALSKMIELNKKLPVDPERQARQFQILMDRMAEVGYEHYEISNFAKPGDRSKHNSSYWMGKPYIGFGPSSHSFYNNIRRWNISNNALYIQSVLNGNNYSESEELSVIHQLNETIMTSIRTCEGINTNEILSRFGKEYKMQMDTAAEKYIEQHKMFRSGDRLVLTNEGKLFADGIAADLFFL